MSLAAHTSSRDRQHHARPPPQPSQSFRTRTPNPPLSDEAMTSAANNNNPGEGPDAMPEEDPRAAMFRARFARAEARLMGVLSGASPPSVPDPAGVAAQPPSSQPAVVAPPAHDARPAATPKKRARDIDEDDYGDDDEDDEDDEDDDTRTSPLLAKSAPNAVSANGPDSSSLRIPPLPGRVGSDRPNTPSSDQLRSSDDVRKKLQQDKKAAEDAAKRSFHTLFYTLENDRDAMLEQQKLDELDRQVETEMSGQPADAPGSGAPAAPQQGTLSTTNLGASSLTLKHLIARIDARRSEVHASDSQLRTLISEVRKNRSKWANEERVGQEELYESMEKVIMELKASEHAHPFLQRVNKREAPDYYTVIKQPMDIGTMMKKLKQLAYKSKKEFVDDLMLIWSNCLKYNADPSHFLRKKALFMRKETEKLVPLIPEITIRDRAEVEAEERRMRNGDADADGADDSEDEEPIMASRGRKAPSKVNKGSSNARKAPPAGLESTPGPEGKPAIPTINSAVSNLKNEFRGDSEMEGSVNGFATPPPGTLTPLGANFASRSAAPGSQADVSEADGSGASVSGFNLETEDAELDDLEYKTWKQVTKKDRAIIAAERNRLFRDDRLNVEEPAILRTKSSMRRWLRHRKHAVEEGSAESGGTGADGKDGVQASAGETLAEGIAGEEDRQVPDYYDPVCVIPDLSDRVQWVEDAEGNVIQQSEEYLRVVPKGHFTAPESTLTKRLESNLRQIQDNRKICSKINIVKQMQLQAQVYQNQFQKYDPLPFVEQDIEPLVVSDEGAIMAPYVQRATLQRSVAKICYHAGFDEFQPSALDALTDIAGDFFQKLVRTFRLYTEVPKKKAEVPVTAANGTTYNWIPKYTQEEAILHALNENGAELEAIETYTDELDRVGSKLSGLHDRMRSHYAELLRPALDPSAGADGAGAFNDGSEQFVGGDFAEDIGEDFFGFRELGLDKELGFLSVPLHLLQNRMHNAYAAQNTNNVATAGRIIPEPPKLEPVTIDNVTSQIGLVQDWFLAKLHDNNDEPLVEDDDLPPKQRYPKPRLPPTGKITSPRKRPLREQQQMMRKKRKLEEEREENANNDSFGTKGLGKPIGKLKLPMPSTRENQPAAEPEKDDGSAVGMISPESIAAA